MSAIKTPEELAKEVLALDNDDKIVFLRAIVDALKKEGGEVSSPLFIAATYIGIGSNWIKRKQKVD